jgi:hypothetical protein
MRALTAADKLSLWERGAGRHLIDRAALLAATARRDVPPEEVASLTLGAVTRALLALRTATFGPRLALVADCERWGERLELTLDAALLSVPASTAGEIVVRGRRMRLPTLADLAAIEGEADSARAVLRLADRCTVSGDGEVDADAIAEIEAALDAHEPDADLSLSLTCAVCGQETAAELDVDALLWDEIAVTARALLWDVHRLASANGWSEAAILSLSTARRAAYLAMVEP